MGDSMEEKLDQDFLFYLTFTKSFFRNLIDKYDVELCQAWLKRLCSETTGVAAKRSRNIYLSQLVLAMQEGKLRGPFQQLPPVGHLASPQCVFGPEESPVIEVLDNLRSMLSKRPAPDDRKKVLEFYQKLIENVDAVWNGAAEPIPEVVNLLKKIQQGLKDVLPPLNAEQHSKTVLTILREKLVRRIAEVSERERKLADAEKFLTKPPEEVSQAELNIPSPLSDVLWNEAINQTPKRQNLIKLQGMYDGALVEKFIQLLANEKGKIIEKFKKQYEKSVRSMKQNLQDRISDAVNAYVIAREDWAEISSLLENVQNAHRAALQAPGEPPSTEQWKVVNQLMDQLRESQEHYEGEIQRGEDLRMLLVAEHQSSHLMKLIAGNNLQQLQNDHSELCDAIHQLVLEIKQQHKRIEELQNLLQ